MRAIPLLITAALLAACSPAKKEEAAAPPPPPPPYATYAGNWSTSAMITGTKDPVPTTMMITADGMGSTMSLKDRPNVPITVSMSGDSLVVTSAEYESVLRKGVMVSTRVASVMEGDMMKGNVEATYTTPKGPEVVKGTSESKRAP